MPPLPGDRTDGLAAQRDHLGRVGEREGARNIGGGDLALRMADHSVGLHAQRPPLRRASDTITANSTGCTTSTRSRPGASGPPRAARRAATSRRTRRMRHRTPASVRRTRLTVHQLDRHPHHCEPWPGKTNTVLAAAPALPVTTFVAGAPSAIAARPPSNSSRSSPTATARWSNDVRRVSDARRRPGRDRVGCSTNSRNRAACSARAAGVVADSAHGTTASGRHRGLLALGGACSRMTWALVPLTPNDDTPARRGSVGRRPRPSSAENLDGPRRPVHLRGGAVADAGWRAPRPFRIASTILIIPATPAACCECPMFDLTEPMSSGRVGSCAAP